MPRESWENEPDEDDYIGIRYRVVLFEDDKRVITAASLRGVTAARKKMVQTVGDYAVAEAEAAGEKIAHGSHRKIRADILDGGMGLRVHFRDGPVNFIIEEDTCEGDPNTEYTEFDDNNG